MWCGCAMLCVARHLLLLRGVLFVGSGLLFGVCMLLSVG